MNKYFFALIISLPVILFIQCKKETAPPPPNVLLILTDDQGYGDLHFHGNDSISTPNLDRLARQSTRFDRFYVSPLCAPTRSSLLTGRYHLRTGTSWVTHRKEVMRSSETTLAELFRANGYATGCFGKWHNGEQYPNDPNGQGFDEFFGFTAGHWNNYFNTTLSHNGTTVKTDGFITDVLTRRAIDFMEKNKDRPFFCYLPYNAPHSPFQVPDKYFDKYKKLGLTDKNASVYGMVGNIDDNVGRLFETLDSLSLSANTIVVFLTDNGPNGHRFNGGMRGVKGSVHEGGMRVPCFLSWPGHLPEDREIGTIAAHIDLLPTLASLCHIKVPDSLSLDGRNLLPLIQNPDASWPARNFFFIQNDGENRMTRGAVRTNRYRFVLDDDGQRQLYDMLTDPAETTDISAGNPALTDSLFNLYQQWFLNVTSDKTPIPVPAGYAGHPSVILPAPEARLGGNAVFNGGWGWANDYISGWSDAGDAATWDLGVQSSGIYEVAMLCNHRGFTEAVFGIGGQGDFPFQTTEDFYPAFYPSPDRVKRGEAYEKDWQRYVLGQIPLEKGPQQLRLFLSKPPEAEGWVFELKGVNILKK